MKRIFSPSQKAAIAIEAVKGLKTNSQLGSQYEAHPVQVGLWKKQLTDNAHTVFSDKRQQEAKAEQEALIERLYRVVGQRDIELEWLKKKLHLDT